MCGRSTVPSSAKSAHAGRTRPTPRKGTHDHHERTPSHRSRSSRSSGRSPHRTRWGGSALHGGVWPPEDGVPAYGPAHHARLQAGLPRECRADGTGHMCARMHDHVPVRQDRLSIRSRHVLGQLPTALATARAAVEWLPRYVRPGSRGVREGRGGANEDLRDGVSKRLRSPRMPPGLRVSSEAGRGDLRVGLPDVPRQLLQFAQGRLRRVTRAESAG